MPRLEVFEKLDPAMIDVLAREGENRDIAERVGEIVGRLELFFQDDKGETPLNKEIIADNQLTERVVDVESLLLLALIDVDEIDESTIFEHEGRLVSVVEGVDILMRDTRRPLGGGHSEQVHTYLLVPSRGPSIAEG